MFRTVELARLDIKRRSKSRGRSGLKRAKKAGAVMVSSPSSPSKKCLQERERERDGRGALSTTCLQPRPARMAGL